MTVQNKYCSITDLGTESDVEQFLITPLLRDLGFPPALIQTKTSISQVHIDKGRRRRYYLPDYLVHITPEHSTPILVIDAKHPDENPLSGVIDAQLYASVLRRGLTSPKPEQYCIGCNGHTLILKHYDSDQILHELHFADFTDGNPAFEALILTIRNHKEAALQPSLHPDDYHAFRNVSPANLPSIFDLCHRKIWKGEKRSPASAFYEFCKLMYVKIDEDRRVRERLATSPPPPRTPDETVPSTAVHFSSRWISQMEQDGTHHAINTVLFRNLTNRLEELISKGDKKRIFDLDEGINLNPSTTKEVVKLLEHLDLGAVDEDLNGRMFEAFLTATMRGKALGQFFTPRAVVKFMVQLARLDATRSKIDTVLDGCCGTGGFLIEAMAELTERITSISSLTNDEKHQMLTDLRTDALWGIDAGADPMIARIARLNMLLHRDGGSRIYQADALDKTVQVDAELPLHSRLELDELRAALTNRPPKQFSVILTNPPFSMNYERKNPSEERILKRYALSSRGGKPRSSLKSSVMFLERYWEVLEPMGRLLTVMDDSVLNTKTNQSIREFVSEKFITKAVIALPKNTFVNAGGTVGTSILYLRKKDHIEESQPPIYMAICANVGHNDTGKDRSELNTLPAILAEIRQFESLGILNEPSRGFLVQPEGLFESNETFRLDAAFFNPQYFTTLCKLNDVAEQRNWTNLPLEDLLLPAQAGLTGGATPSGARYSESGPKFIRVQNVRPNRIEWSAETDPCVPTDIHNGQLARSQLKAGDVIFTITGSYGNAAVVPDGFGDANINQHSVRMRVREAKVSPHYLAAFLNSTLCRPQVDRAVTGSSRPALDYQSVRRLRILVPESLQEQEAVADQVIGKVEKARALARELATVESEMLEMIDGV